MMCLCAARLTLASVSSARRSLIFCFFVHDVFLACAIGVCNGPRRCFSFSDLLDAPGCMHLHSVCMVTCCVRGHPFPARACAVCSYTTSVRCVRDEDTSRRFRSCTGHQVGSCLAFKSKEHRKFRSHDSNALILKITILTNISHPKPVHKRYTVFTQCKPV